MFSSRVAGHAATNRLALAVGAHRSTGRELLDLTVTNPTTCGFVYPEDILAPLSGVDARCYRPEPFGLRSARDAVASDYRRRGISVATGPVDAARIVLTASTSEAYSLLFKLLCDAGRDEVLVPVPSYPLFDHLTALDGVGQRSYALEYHGRWQVDDASVDTAWTTRIRAVLAVSPNNPTGSVLTPRDLGALARRCADRDAALIIDEVFADYLLTDPPPPLPPSLLGGCLNVRLGGLSKSAGLPQVKLGWMLIDGPDHLVGEALARLEVICDAYLSVSTPVQLAAADLLERGAAIRTQIQERIRTNFSTLAATVAARPAVQLLNADGGWSAVLRVPSNESEEELVVRLLNERDTLVHPGFFFDFPHEAFLVLSLLPPPAVFARGVTRLLDGLDA